jgi:hypothetical protein
MVVVVLGAFASGCGDDEPERSALAENLARRHTDHARPGKPSLVSAEALATRMGAPECAVRASPDR